MQVSTGPLRQLRVVTYHDELGGVRGLGELWRLIDDLAELDVVLKPIELVDATLNLFFFLFQLSLLLDLRVSE